MKENDYKSEHHVTTRDDVKNAEEAENATLLMSLLVQRGCKLGWRTHKGNKYCSSIVHSPAVIEVKCGSSGRKGYMGELG